MRRNDRIYNIVSIIFLTLSAIACLGFTITLIMPGEATSVAELPTEVMIPSTTPTYTPTITRTPFPATFTPTFTPTITPSLTPSITPSITPSLTITATDTITPTPDVTSTPTATETLIPTITPAGPTVTPPSPYIFGLQGAPNFTRNFANSAGCAWQGVGGQVFGLNGATYTNPLIVRVFGGPLPQDLTATTGTNSFYGGSGFEVQVGNSINTQTYFAQLETRNGTKISDVVQLTFPGDCERNVALLTFIQLREP